MALRDILLYKYLHLYLHANPFSWPFIRYWTSSISRGTLQSRGRYQRLQQQNADAEEDATDLSLANDAVETTDGPLEDSPHTRPHAGSCTGSCLVAHISLHLGFTLFVIALLVAAIALWKPIHTLLNAGTNSGSNAIAVQPGVSSSANDKYVLNPNWDFDAPVQTRNLEWTITDAYMNPDGVYRPMMLINGKFPGPLVECNKGDRLQITVRNRAENATSIHWHGLYQNGTNHMDGTVGVTSCAIAPGQDFVYEFQVEHQSGTYFYHGHQGLQGSDGLVGPLIVHSKAERQMQDLRYASDRVIMVQDHYYDLSGALMMQYLQPGNENEEPIPDGALINGKNVRNCERVPGRRCDNTGISLWTAALDPLQNHRLRFINVGAFAEFQIQIDEHEFAVTEVDGTDVIPAFYHRLNINPAQRYSIVLTSRRVNPDESYWLRARMLTQCFSEKKAQLEPEVRGIIRYKSSGKTPTSLDWNDVVEVECRDMNTSQLVPLVAATPPEPDSFFYVRSNFEIGDWRLSRGFFNQSSWRPNKQSPILLRSLDGLSANNESFEIGSKAGVNQKAFDTSQELVIQTEGVQTVDVAIQNFDDGNHPMHLHGYKFWVLGSGRGHFDAESIYLSLDVSNALRRDTASVEAYSWLLIRFVADNPGAWAFHCHLAWHAEAGLLMTFITRTDILRELAVSDSSRKLCQANGLEKGMPPSDEIWYGTGVG